MQLGKKRKSTQRTRLVSRDTELFLVRLSFFWAACQCEKWRWKVKVEHIADGNLPFSNLDEKNAEMSQYCLLALAHWHNTVFSQIRMSHRCLFFPKKASSWATPLPSPCCPTITGHFCHKIYTCIYICTVVQLCRKKLKHVWTNMLRLLNRACIGENCNCKYVYYKSMFWRNSPVRSAASSLWVNFVKSAHVIIITILE